MTLRRRPQRPCQSLVGRRLGILWVGPPTEVKPFVFLPARRCRQASILSLCRRIASRGGLRHDPAGYQEGCQSSCRGRRRHVRACRPDPGHPVTSSGDWPGGSGRTEHAQRLSGYPLRYSPPAMKSESPAVTCCQEKFTTRTDLPRSPRSNAGL